MTDWRLAIDTIQNIITGGFGSPSRNVVMNDIQTSPAIPQAFPLPLFLQPLDQRYKETNDDDTSPTCDWLGIPTPDKLPSPGQAKTWHKDEWMEWSKNNGFVFEGETTHSWTWKHPLANTLVISVAKTPGDFRTPMAMATQTRRAVREFAVRVNVVMRNLISTGFDFKDVDESGVKLMVVKLVQSKGEAESTVSKLHYEELQSGKLSKTLTDLVNVIGRITKDFGIPPAKTMSHLLGTNTQDGQAEWDRWKLFDPDHPIANSMVEDAKDYLDSLRDMERAEKEEKRADRDREDAEREAKRLAKIQPKTSQQVMQEMVDRHDDQTVSGIKGCMGAVMSALDRLRALEAQVAKGIDIPVIEDPAMKAEIAAKTTALEAAEKRMSDKDRFIQEQMIQIQGLEAQVSQVSVERLAHLNNVERHLHALAGLVVSTVEEAKKGNSFQMVEALNNLVAEAKHFLPKE